MNSEGREREGGQGEANDQPLKRDIRQQRREVGELVHRSILSKKPKGLFEKCALLDYTSRDSR